MALSDADFLLQFQFDDATVFVEADRRTVYAYVGQPKDGEARLNGDAWLFNLVEAPEEPEWGPGMETGPRNPRIYARAFDLDGDLREEAFTASEIEVDGQREWTVEYAGRPIGLVWLGAKPGCSTFAAENSPIALTMPSYALE